jgi:hypothetical protein
VWVSIETAIAEIARSGYPEAMSSDSARAVEALGLSSATPLPASTSIGDGATQRRCRPMLRRNYSVGE